jgi:hypothetical protein
MGLRRCGLFVRAAASNVCRRARELVDLSESCGNRRSLRPHAPDCRLRAAESMRRRTGSVTVVFAGAASSSCLRRGWLVLAAQCASSPLV